MTPISAKEHIQPSGLPGCSTSVAQQVFELIRAQLAPSTAIG
jgi:hypothetical protein